MWWSATGGDLGTNTGYSCVQLTSPGAYGGACIVDPASGLEAMCCEATAATTIVEMNSYEPEWTGTHGAGVTGVTLATGDWVGIRRTAANTYFCFAVDGGTYVDGASTPDSDALIPATSRGGLSDSNGTMTLNTWQAGPEAVVPSGACGRP